MSYRAVALTLAAGCVTAELGACAIPPAAVTRPSIARPSASRPPAPPVVYISGCPVTQPAVAPDLHAPGAGSNTLFGDDSAYGNDQLWVGGLGSGGVIDDPRMVQPDASVRWKFGWYRLVPGGLRITGRRLDGPARALHAEIPDGYGDIGFQATGVDFPTAGCWEVTGTVGNGRLTFVTLVRSTQREGDRSAGAPA
jgi:hypothetical protein